MYSVICHILTDSSCSAEDHYLYLSHVDAELQAPGPGG